MVEVSYIKSKKKGDKRFKIKKNGKEKIIKIKGKNVDVEKLFIQARELH